jgi:hypothetical protein
VIQDSQFFVGLLATLEAYADSFEQVASTGSQEAVADQFRQFVTGLPGLMMAAAKKQEAELAQAIFGLDGGPKCEREGAAGLPRHSREAEAGRER